MFGVRVEIEEYSELGLVGLGPNRSSPGVFYFTVTLGQRHFFLYRLKGLLESYIAKG